MLDPKLSANETAKKGLESMALLFKYLDIFGVANKVRLLNLLSL